MSFALFGRTPEQTRVRDLLTLGKDHGEVRLTFASRGEFWRVTRRYGKDAPEPAHLLERLDGDGGATSETIGGDEAVAARLRTVVGMSFDAFTSAVLLAQGRFARFLGSAPRERDAILRELFGVASLEGARQAAQRHAAAATAEADLRAADAAGLTAGTWAGRAAAARAARATEVAHAGVRGLRPLAAAEAVHAAAARTARERAAAARRAADDLPGEDAARELIARLRGAREGAGAAEAARVAAAADLDVRVRARDDARARHGGGGAELAALRERAARAALLAAELPARAAVLDDADAALTTRRAALEGLRATLAEAVAAHEAAAARARALEACADAERRAADAIAARDAAARDEAAAVAAHAEASAAAEAAQAAHEAVRRHDLAVTVMAGLAPGDPCPVCGGVVGAHPPEVAGLRAGDEDLGRVRAAVAQAGAAEGAARERARAAAAAADAAEARRDEVRRELEVAGVDRDGETEDARAVAHRAAAIEAARGGVVQEERAIDAESGRVGAERTRLGRDRDDLASARTALGAWGAHADPAAALGTAMQEVGAAEAAADAAGATAAAAAARAADAHAQAAAIEAGPVASLRATAARVAAQGSLEAPPDDLPAEELIEAARALRTEAVAAAERHAAAAAEAEHRTAAAREALAARGADLGVAAAADLDAALRRHERARDAARARLGDAEAAAAEARRLRGLAAAAREAARVHQQVAADLRANGFPRFLLGRFRERLAIEASARLQELTSGQYRFAGTEPDPLAVVDQRRGERLRPAGSLSGGERFLASLALALGLGDIAAESGGRLDCLFLDEGFSTLDAESLEQALAGVERLAGEGRLIGVITHLPGVADRLGAEIRVAKDPEGVSRIAPA